MRLLRARPQQPAGRSSTMKAWKRIVSAIMVSTAITATPFAKKLRNHQSDSAADLRMNSRINRFAPTTLTANTASLSPNDRQALLKIIAAAKLFDPLYLRQIWSGNEALLKKLQADQSPIGRLRLHYFMINKGPLVTARRERTVHRGRSVPPTSSQLLPRRHD